MILFYTMGGSLPQLDERAMNNTPQIFLGIDPTSGRQPYSWAALDKDCCLVSINEGNLDHLLEYVENFESIFAAVNTPWRPNLGLVREKLTREKKSLNIRGGDMRMVEYLLREHGISIPPTPSREENCPTWFQIGFLLYRELGKIGFHFQAENSTRYMFEVNAHSIFCVLLGQTPLPKPTIEGRIQRQLILHNNGLNIKDPMDFFVEITRHKLLRGHLPMEYIYESHELDTLAAAYTAWLACNAPEEVLRLGDKEEGQIVLPVKELKEIYQ